jgi:CheY-like chemotaxis protein
MPGVTGGMVYEMIRAKVGPYLPVVVCSGTRLKFKERDPLRAFLLKPVGCEAMLKMLGDLIGLAATLLQEEEAAAEHQPPGTDDDDLD